MARNRKYRINIVFIIGVIGLISLKSISAEEVFMPNMHMQLGCETCHQTPAEVGVDTRETVKLTSPQNDVIALCDPCHTNQEAHPVAVNPKDTNMIVPDHLPLGLKGTPSEGKIICTTCHDIHAEFSSGNTQKIELCKDCHGADLLKRSPHKGDEKSCSFCHGADPKKQAQEGATTIKLEIGSLCNFCHENELSPHFLKFSSLFSDVDLKDALKKMTLPLSSSKKLTCVTCHNPHGSENPKKHYLREEFVSLGGKSNKINPHWTDTFCTSCHDKTGTPQETTFKFNNNLDESCLWCHKGQEAAELHPYGIPAKDSKFTKINKDKMKIVKDTISCITCHGKDCEKKKATVAKNFLRGGPYVERNDLCFNCHIKEVFKKINPHRQKDPQGKINYDVCTDCHVGVPDENKKENLALKGNEVFLCLRCHADRPHPGTNVKTGLGVNHIVVPREIPNKMAVPKDVPLSKKGSLMCSSCHPSHLSGVTKKESKRLMSNECTVCHVGI
ncbi:cytochrome c3 family protein [Candidatus Desantisbacteria bacterium]|nr:cytochrome c3 family protein [Candidatus Desantisbacteria bacterium]